MEWFYAANNEKLGPVDHDTFTQLVQDRTITANTLVWRTGMADWQPYGVLVAQSNAQSATGAPEAGADWQQCVECGNAFPAGEMLSYGDSMICATCKPIFFQRLREGAALPGTMRFGGFWIRVGAKLIDGIIVGVVWLILFVLVLVVFMGDAFTSDQSPSSFGGALMMIMVYVVPTAMQIAYNTFFVGKTGSTPGKMAVGLKIVRPDGEALTYARACGRAFAEMLSGMVMYIGYIMVAFDDEKRSLHDHICDTRVISVR